jgi:phosphoglycolate phosphatase
VLIDLDGTLVDTIPDIAFSIDHMLAELGMPAAGQERVREWVGNGTEVLVRRALAAANDGEVREADYDRALPIFRDFYARHVCDRSRVYDGVPAGLDYLHGCGARLACVTNKSEEFTSRLLAALTLDRHFSLVLSGDSLARRKPDPLPLLHAAGHFGVAPADSLFIGDSEYNHGRDIRTSEPDAVVDSLAELPTLFPPSLQANGAG